MLTDRRLVYLGLVTSLFVAPLLLFGVSAFFYYLWTHSQAYFLLILITWLGTEILLRWGSRPFEEWHPAQKLIAGLLMVQLTVLVLALLF